MIVRSTRKINKIKKYPFKLSINYQYKLIKKVGSYIDINENIAFGHVGDFREIDLHNELEDFNEKKDKKYILVEEGEIILEGTPIFKREKFFGSAQEEIVSPMDGVVKLDEVSKGIIRIVGEKKKKHITTPFAGILSSIKQNEHITMEIDGIQIPCMNVYGIDKSIHGPVVRIDNPDRSFSDLKGKIVLTEFTLNIVDFEKIFALGALAVISQSFNIEEHADIDRFSKYPFALINGFGEIPFYDIPQIDYALIDNDKKTIIFQNKHYFVTQSNDNFDELKVGDYVKIVRSDLWGHEGQVTTLNENTAKIESGMTVVEIPYIYLIKIQ